jgi:molecular chaperone DnaK (HSP70)
MSACPEPFRIGIDLGTTNCALASIAPGSGQSTVLEIPQPAGENASVSAPTLPSFLYLPPGSARWVAGHWARTRAAEVPGRVVSSAKSWMVHHAADRRANFLPLGTPDLTPEQRLSPVGALALQLRYLADTWNAAHPDALLAAQNVAITVPASFDPAAQQLTLEAAREAGFPATTLLLEEPQAAFYAWMESAPGAAASLCPPGGGAAHVLVVDLGGGTTDLSLFAIEPGSPAPRLHRIAVSEHLLLGGDNLDLALAHHLESRLAPDSQLPAGSFAQLVARCREIKEEALAADEERTWPVAVAAPGASLLKGTLRTEISTPEIARLVLEGFFPEVGAGEIPQRASAGLREMGLPYAKDAAITRHLADFLRGRPAVDFVLFNGGLTKSPAIRRRVLENLGRWQPGRLPQVLDNIQPDLAVARGAARFLHLRATGDQSAIEAGAACSYYVGVGGDRLVCVLPQGAAPEAAHLTDIRGLQALVGKPAAFTLWRHARRPQDQPGDLVGAEGFSELPGLETILVPPPGAGKPKTSSVRVKLRATLRSTGLLRLELLCAEPGLKWDAPWPLEFALRQGRAEAPARQASAPAARPSGAVPQAAAAMAAIFEPSRKTNQKITANAVFSAGEKVLAQPKAAWTGGIVRELFDQLPPQTATAAHEEAWLQVAGYLLRPGCGVGGDEARVTLLSDTLSRPPAWPSGAVKIQRWIAARRIAAGLDTARAEAIWKEALAAWRNPSSPPAEIVLLAGALESLPLETRQDIGIRLASALETQPQNAACWKSLGRLLSRILFHRGADQVLPPEFVTALWEKLALVEIPEPARPDAATAWLRAARLTGLRPLDVPRHCRHQINNLLRGWGLTDVRRRVLEEVVPLAASDQTSLLGESPPPGLHLAE